MRTQLCKLCLILEPKWFKLITRDWKMENILILLCLLCSIRVLLVVKYDLVPS